MNLRQNQKGFTIVELLIVIVVIAILAAISIVAYTGIQDRARNSAAIEMANQVAGKVRAYYAISGSYPTGFTGTTNKTFTPAVTDSEEANLGNANIVTGPAPTAPYTGDYASGTQVNIVWGTATTPPTIHYRTGGSTSGTMTP